MKGFFRFPWLVVAAIGAITVFFAVQMPRAILDNDMVNFIPKDSAEVKAYEAQQDLYGSQTISLMALKNPTGTVFDKAFLLKLRELTEKIAALPETDSVTSLANTDSIQAEGDSIVVKPLMGDDFTGTAEQIASLKEGVLSWDLYRKSLVSDDFRSTQILIAIKASMEVSAPGVAPIDNKKVIYGKIQQVLAEVGTNGYEVYQAGTPVMAVLMSQNMVKDLVVLIPLVILVVVGILFVSFRRLGGILLPLATVAISSVWAIGLMALLGVKLTMISTVIPVILMAVGSAYGIHVISHYYDAALSQRRTQTKEEYTDLVLGVLQKISLPVILAGLTTMAGFGSLALTSIIPVRDFGVFSTFGVLAALVTALTFIPALLLIRGPHEIKGSAPAYHPEQDPLARGLLKVLRPIILRPRTTLVVAVAILGLSIWGASKVVVDNATVEFFKGDTEISRADAFLRSDFNGTKSFNINVKGTQRGDLNHPQILAAMDDLQTYLEAEFPEVGKVLSYSQFIKRINQVLNADEPAEGLRGATAAATAAVDENAEVAFGFDFGFEDPAPAPASTSVVKPEAAPALDRTALLGLLNQAVTLADRRDIGAEELLSLINRTTNYQGAAYYEVPRDPERYNQADEAGLKTLVANYLVLVGEGTDEWADDPLEPTQARMMVQINSTGNLATGKISQAIENYVATHFPEGYTVELAGLAFIEKGVTDLIVQSQVWNIVSSFVLVIIILTVFFRSGIAGALSIVPLTFGIVINFGLMGFLGIKLDAATSMVSAIAIGTGIDYTIHFLVAFHRGRQTHGGDYHANMEQTILTTGKAILFNAVAVAAGFTVLAFSTFNPLMYLGILVAFTMATTSLAALTLLPVLLDLLQPKFLDKPMLTETLGGQE